MRATWLPVPALLAGCINVEKGIDRSTIAGVVEIPPHRIDANEVSAPGFREYLGELAYPVVVVRAYLDPVPVEGGEDRVDDEPTDVGVLTDAPQLPPPVQGDTGGLGGLFDTSRNTDWFGIIPTDLGLERPDPTDPRPWFDSATRREIIDALRPDSGLGFVASDLFDTSLPHTGGWTDSGWGIVPPGSDWPTDQPFMSDTASTDLWVQDSGEPPVTGDVDIYTFEVGPSGAYTVRYTGPAAAVEDDRGGGGGGADVAFTGEAPPGTYVAVRVGGAGELGAYTLAILGEDPNDAGFNVAAFTGRTWDDRGLLAGGTTVDVLALDEDFVWRGDYLITFLRTVDGSAAPDADGVITPPTVAETPAQVTLWASDAPRLGRRPAGTWFSSTPVRVSPTGYAPLNADPLRVDAVAPIVIGWTQGELEPNHPAFDDAGNPASLDPGTFQDLGALSGSGFVDLFDGQVAFDAGGAGVDDDRFRFSAPANVGLSTSLSWAGGADIDWYLFDAAGAALDQGASVANPELGDGAALTAGGVYQLVVVPYEGPANAVVSYQLRFEVE